MKASELGKKMIICILCIACVCSLGSIVYHRSLNFIPFLIGIILGSAVSITKVFLLEYTVDKALAMEKATAKNFVSLHHILRLAFTGLVLYLGAVLPHVSLWGVAVGVLSFQFALYMIKLTSKNGAKL